ncbi:hypothetical protein PsYK624_170850 [Phanerochaete sordida]|uniref:Uncharacterized protein n=1 Tax=Phanerochaete sordida TaxID=48140 RepID=A0A9P3LMF4_9APHY|nr:hypothetical protein PsYK624_170850 [Phanerochaete sordida]
MQSGVTWAGPCARPVGDKSLLSHSFTSLAVSLTSFAHDAFVPTSARRPASLARRRGPLIRDATRSAQPAASVVAGSRITFERNA